MLFFHRTGIVDDDQDIGAAAFTGLNEFFGEVFGFCFGRGWKRPILALGPSVGFRDSSLGSGAALGKGVLRLSVAPLKLLLLQAVMSRGKQHNREQARDRLSIEIPPGAQELLLSTLVIGQPFPKL